MLFEKFYEPCTRMVFDRVPDGEGGWSTEKDDGAGFMAAVVLDTSSAALIAESAGMARRYTVTTPVGVSLGFHEVFRRDSDGRAFRVTSDPGDRRTPGVASFSFEQVTAEAWVIPGE